MSETNTLKTVKGKRKVVKLSNSESIMEGNTVELPFLAPYKVLYDKDTGEPTNIITSVRYVWTTNVNGKPVTRGVRVSGDGELGVPTLKDKEVFRALQDIYIRSKIEDGVLDLETDKSLIKESDLIINFDSVDEIATAMGIKTLSGQRRKAIKESIQRLVASTMFSTHEGGIYDRQTKKYITDSTISYRYLEGMESYTVCDCENCLYVNGCSKLPDKCIAENKRVDITKIKMPMFLYLNIASNYRLYYNTNNSNKIKNLIAKNIYLISKKWLGNKSEVKADIHKYMDRIPMNAKQEKHRKQAIKDGIDKLNEYDFVEAYYEGDMTTVRHLDIKRIKGDDLPTENNYLLSDRFNTFKDLKQGFVDLGFDEDEFDEIVDLQRIEYFKAVLRYITLKCKYDSSINGKEYFKNYIKNNTQIDDRYYSR